MAPHESPFQYLLRKGIAPITTTPGPPDHDQLGLALDRLYQTPNDLTVADVQQLTGLNVDLGQLAHAKMLGYTGDHDARQAAGGVNNPITHAAFAKWEQLLFKPLLLMMRQHTTGRLAQQDRQVAALEQRQARTIAALEQRVTALEAQLAAALQVAG